MVLEGELAVWNSEETALQIAADRIHKQKEVDLLNDYNFKMGLASEGEKKEVVVSSTLKKFLKAENGNFLHVCLSMFIQIMDSHVVSLSCITASRLYFLCCFVCR